MYDSPHSAAGSTWIIHTTVSYSVGPGYTKMITGAPATSTSTSWGAPASTGTGSWEAVSGKTSAWVSTPAAPTPTPAQYKGDAAKGALGVGAVAVAGLAMLL
jgi:hypothetical protein